MNNIKKKPIKHKLLCSLYFFFNSNKGKWEKEKQIQMRIFATPNTNRTKKMRRSGNVSKHKVGNGPFSYLMSTKIGTSRGLQS
jgi:hypothetical protein